MAPARSTTAAARRPTQIPVDPDELPELALAVVVVAGGAVVVVAPAPAGVVVVVVAVVGSTIVSRETEVPEWQSTAPPPTACQVDPVTWRSSAGYCVVSVVAPAAPRYIRICTKPLQDAG